MAKLIRKISVGKDYKNDAMHYAVWQEVYGGHTICDIIEEENKFTIIYFLFIVISFSFWRYNKVVNTFH